MTSWVLSEPSAALLWGLAMSEPGGDAPPSQEELAHRAKTGDRQAFADLVRATQRPVWGLCRRMLFRDAEALEATQETFLRAYQRLSSFDPARRFDHWVLAIAQNHCRDLLRRQAREALDAPALVASASVSLEEEAIARQERRALGQALEHLSASDREVIELYYVQRRTTKEIAEILGVASGTIMARLFRAREKLRAHLAPGGAL